MICELSFRCAIRLFLLAAALGTQLFASGVAHGQDLMSSPAGHRGPISGIVLVKVRELPNEQSMFSKVDDEIATSLGSAALSKFREYGLDGIRVMDRHGDITTYALMFNSVGREADVIAYLMTKPRVIEATRDYPLTLLAEPNDYYYQPDAMDYEVHWVPNAANYYYNPATHLNGRKCTGEWQRCCCEAPCSEVVPWPFQTRDSIHYSDQWYLQRARANKAWDIEKGQGSVKILVIDSGIDIDHPDLDAHIWDNSTADGKWDTNHDGLPGGCCGFNSPALNKDIDGDEQSLFGSDNQCDCGPDGDYGFGPNAIDDDPPGPGGGDDDSGPEWADNPRGPGSQHPEIPFNDDRDDIVFMRCDDDANGYPDDTHGVNLYDLVQDYGLNGVPDGDLPPLLVPLRDSACPLD